MAGSYAVLGASALLWPLATTLVVGFLLITFTGVLEGPAYAGTIALRQRHVFAAVNLVAAAVAARAGQATPDTVRICYWQPVIGGER